MDFNNYKIILTEGAVIERIRREFSFPMDNSILNAELVFTKDGKDILNKIYKEYIHIAIKFDLPIIILTPTWKVNSDNCKESNRELNKTITECCSFLNTIRDNYPDYKKNIFIGGLVGCKNDAYNAKLALEKEEAYNFHKKHISILANQNIDFLIASTLPALSESIGIAQAMSETMLPYILSFVLNKEGNLLDSNSMELVISNIDNSSFRKPDNYMLNCIYPETLNTALLKISTENIRDRVLGIQANTSVLSPQELEGLSYLDTEEPAIFAKKIANIKNKYNLKIIGGCCGTNEKHIDEIAKLCTFNKSQLY
jgi:homocysteine S-methyltransferase